MSFLWCESGYIVKSNIKKWKINQWRKIGKIQIMPFSRRQLGLKFEPSLWLINCSLAPFPASLHCLSIFSPRLPKSAAQQKVATLHWPAFGWRQHLPILMYSHQQSLVCTSSSSISRQCVMISKPVQNSEFPAFQAHLLDLAWAALKEVFMIGSYFSLLSSPK